MSGGILGPAFERQRREAEISRRATAGLERLVAELEATLPGVFNRRTDQPN